MVFASRNGRAGASVKEHVSLLRLYCVMQTEKTYVLGEAYNFLEMYYVMADHYVWYLTIGQAN